MRAMVIVALFVSGCVADATSNPHYGCTGDADCAPDETCERGFCIPRKGDEPGQDEEPDCDDPALRCYEGPEGTEGVGLCKPGCLREVDGELLCDGQVLPSSEQCNGADDDCDGRVDEDFPLDSTDQCGACDTQCASGETCCPGPEGGHECANFASDANHCGRCGFPCPTGTVCCGGECVDISEDDDNCGACGRRCDDRLECCDGTCVNTNSSSAHCGGCGVASCDDTQVCCPSTGDTTARCRQPDECVKCDVAPDDPDKLPCEEDEGDLCCGGECVKDHLTNDAHCGGCGIACAANERCCEGRCVPLDENCAECGNACGSNSQCCSGSCVGITEPTNCGGCGVTCSAGQTCCGGEAGCVNTLTNNSHCGGCKQPCGDNVCVNGHCCPPGQHFCDGQCVPLSSNDHCGACGNECRGGFLIFRETCTACSGGGFGCAVGGC